jgi:hypothetical protein
MAEAEDPPSIRQVDDTKLASGWCLPWAFLVQRFRSLAAQKRTPPASGALAVAEPSNASASTVVQQQFGGTVVGSVGRDAHLGVHHHIHHHYHSRAGEPVPAEGSGAELTLTADEALGTGANVIRDAATAPQPRLEGPSGAARASRYRWWVTAGICIAVAFLVLFFAFEKLLEKYPQYRRVRSWSSLFSTLSWNSTPHRKMRSLQRRVQGGEMGGGGPALGQRIWLPPRS